MRHEEPCMAEIDLADLKTLPLDALHKRLGGRMVPFAGYAMPVQYPTGVMAEHGFSVRMSDRFSVWPQEALELIFTCSPVAESGLPYGVKSGSDQPMRALVAARKTIETVLSQPVDAAELASCKSLLANNYSTYLLDTDNYIDAILMRYSAGKDVLTGYNNRIGSVSADKVKEIFGTLSEGMRIEYVVKQ